MHATMLIDWMARAGIAWGDWRCAGCGQDFYRSKRPGACAHCACTVFRYREQRVKSLISGIDGGIDVIVDLPGRKKMLVVEIKSYAKEKFKELLMPLAEHRSRTALYLRCLAESGDVELLDLVDTTEARIFYVTKGGWGIKTSKPFKEWGLSDRGWTPFKEFTIHADDQLTDPYVETAEPLHRWRTEQGPMPSGICPHALASRAEHCEMREVCFSGKYPAGVKL